MKILWITKGAAFVGGAERHIADVVPLLTARGASNYLLYAVDSPVDPEFVALFDGAFPQVDVPRQLRELAPDCLYIHQVAGCAAVDELADAGIPAVRFFHDHAPFCLRGYKYTTLGHQTCSRTLGPYCLVPCLGPINKVPGFPPIHIRTLRAARAELAANRRFDTFAVGSVYMKDHVVAHGFAPAAVRVLPMFAPAWDDDPGATASDLDEHRDPNLLLFVGALLRGKGLDILLAAMALLPRTVRLRVAGSGHQEAMFRAQAETLGLGDRVEFLGKVKRPALERHYRTAACVVVPSREPETFGLVGLEAYRHATPVVAARVGGTGDWLHEGVTGYGFPSGDAAALAEAIRKVLADPAAARALGEAGRTLAATRFTAEHHATALWNLLESTIRSGRSA
jgi:glycosyltransferase involved in cell wall biosynthesis